MSGFEQNPDFNGNQVSNAVGAVSLGMPSLRVANNPFMTPQEVIKPSQDEWETRGLCREVDREMFFPEKGESTSAAKAVCKLCEFREACLENALENNIQFGIWGGMTEPERRALKRSREQASKIQ
jgi:WhiB family redox-sensing transcriptional regulator